jgi:hypothetical protein
MDESGRRRRSVEVSEKIGRGRRKCVRGRVESSRARDESTRRTQNKRGAKRRRAREGKGRWEDAAAEYLAILQCGACTRARGPSQGRPTQRCRPWTRPGGSQPEQGRDTSDARDWPTRAWADTAEQGCRAEGRQAWARQGRASNNGAARRGAVATAPLSSKVCAYRLSGSARWRRVEELVP